MSNTPANGTLGVPLNESVSASFSEAMDPATLNTSTFTLTSGAADSVQGTVAYANSTAVFWPTSRLASNETFTATITTGAKSAAGVALPTNQVWSLTTGSALASGIPVDIGTAGHLVILAKTGISTASTSTVTGDIGVSPIAATAITGFSLSVDSSGQFSTSSQVTGKVYAASYIAPTPANMSAAVSAMEAAFTEAAGQAPDFVGLNSGNIGGLDLVPGVYKWSTGLLIPTDVTLTGSATDVWIFQIAQDLTMSSGAKMILAGGARPENVYWQVSGLVDLGTTAHIGGVILCQTAITLNTGASVYGRLLAQTKVTLGGNTVTELLTPATAVAIAANQPISGSPITFTPPVTFTVVGSGSLDDQGNAAPASAYQYQFWVRWNGAPGYAMVQDYGVGSTYTLPGSTPPGTYGIGVDVRTSPYVLWDTFSSINYFNINPVGLITNPTPRMSEAVTLRSQPAFLGWAGIK